MAAPPAPGWAAVSREEKVAQLRLLKEDLTFECEKHIRYQSDVLCANVDKIIKDTIYQLPKKFREITIDEAFKICTAEGNEDLAPGAQVLGVGPSASSKGAGPKRVRDGQTQTVLYARKKVKSAGGLPEEETQPNILDRPTPVKATSPAKTGLVNLTPLRGTGGTTTSNKPRPAPANVTADAAATPGALAGSGNDAQPSGGAAGGGPRPSILEVPVGHRFDSLDQKDRQAWLKKLSGVLTNLMEKHNKHAS